MMSIKAQHLQQSSYEPGKISQLHTVKKVGIMSQNQSDLMNKLRMKNISTNLDSDKKESNLVVGESKAASIEISSTGRNISSQLSDKITSTDFSQKSSSIRDVDYESEMKKVRDYATRDRNQAQTTMLAQANQTPNAVLKLLQ